MPSLFGYFEEILAQFKTHQVCIRSLVGSNIQSCLRLMVRCRGTIKSVVITEVTIQSWGAVGYRGERVSLNQMGTWQKTKMRKTVASACLWKER